MNPGSGKMLCFRGEAAQGWGWAVTNTSAHTGGADLGQSPLAGCREPAVTLRSAPNSFVLWIQED